MTFLHACFRPGFRHRFSSLLDGFWPPTWAYFGSFLSNFSVLSWWSILKSIFNRFFIDFWPPDTSEIELPPTRESNFQVFLLLILSSLLDSILAPKTHPKSAPRCSKISSDLVSKISSTWKWILIATWLQLGPQLGDQKRDPGSIFSNLTYFFDDENWGQIFITPFWAPRPSGIDFLSVFDRFLIVF